MGVVNMVGYSGAAIMQYLVGFILQQFKGEVINGVTVYPDYAYQNGFLACWVGKLFYGLILVFFLVDFFTKRWAESKLNLGQTINFIPEWLTWNLIHNKGASFGILSGYTSFLIGIGVMAILFIFYLHRRSETKSFVVQISFALVIGGAIGNIVDRILLGYVIDFIEFRWWPAIFNIADIEIRVGTLLIFYLFLTKRWKF